MKILRYVTFVLAFIFGYICLMYFNSSFAYYARRASQYIFLSKWLYLPPAGSSVHVLLFAGALLLCAAALTTHLLTVVKGEPDWFLRTVRQLNAPLYVLYTVATLIIGGCMPFLLKRNINMISMILFPLLVYTLYLLWIDGTLYRWTFSARETARMRKTYDSALAEQVKSERFKTELITNVTHDIKTPLTSIINYIDLIDRLGLDHEELKTYTAVLQKKAQRLKTLLDDLLEATKAGTGNLTIDLHPLDFAELIGQAAGEFEEVFQNNGLEWVFTRGQHPAEVMADGRHLYRVLENILSNAGKYALGGTRIYAGLHVDSQNRVVFALKNISREPLNITADELTERFTRGDRARHTEGSGLGLYIAKSLTEAMNGEFTLEINGDLFCVALALKKCKP